MISTTKHRCVWEIHMYSASLIMPCGLTSFNLCFTFSLNQYRTKTLIRETRRHVNSSTINCSIVHFLTTLTLLWPITCLIITEILKPVIDLWVIICAHYRSNVLSRCNRPESHFESWCEARRRGLWPQEWGGERVALAAVVKLFMWTVACTQ